MFGLVWDLLMNISTSSWKCLPDQSYERPLGMMEAGFYWDTVFARTADIIRCSQITVVAGHLDEIIDLQNVMRAWTYVKKRFPLLGSRVYERDNEIFLKVSTDQLLACKPNEISFRDVSSYSEAVQLADHTMEMEKQLSNELLARIVIAKDQSRTDCFYFLFAYAHFVADGLSSMMMIKTFVNELCGVSLDQPVLEERLALSVASEDLNPAATLNKARRRWRSAIAAILSRRKMAKLQGGHALPQKVSEKTQYTPSKSMHRSFTFSSETTTRIIQNCRKKGITFGNAYPIISQVASARVLLRHYLQGKIDEDEWDFRKKEPMYSAGPSNLRPRLDPGWFAAGGLDHVCVAIGFHFYSISFLPLGPAADLKPGMMLPEVGGLLTRERFLYRAKSIQKQAKAQLNSPLSLEVGESRVPRRVEIAREMARRWETEGTPCALSDRVLTPMERSAGYVICNGGSSIGNMDKFLPSEYPMASHESLSKVKLRLGQVLFRLRCRPGELYLGAATLQNQLTSFVHFDSNVFDEALVDEWLAEIKMALEFYLGEEDT